MPIPIPDGGPFGYTLYLDEKEDLENIIRKLKDIDLKKEFSFRIACDRFNKSYYSILPEDKLVDICIGFESLYLKGEYQKSDLGMGQVIGLACSMLLGNNNKEREDISKVLEVGFSLRNRVVHGREYDSSKISKILPDLEDYLRKSILSLIP